MSSAEQFEAWHIDHVGRKPMLDTPSGHWVDDKKAFAAWQESRRASIEECCAAIKTEDDRASDEDYILDSDDCIRVLRALLDAAADIDAGRALSAEMALALGIGKGCDADDDLELAVWPNMDAPQIAG